MSMEQPAQTQPLIPENSLVSRLIGSAAVAPAESCWGTAEPVVAAGAIRLPATAAAETGGTERETAAAGSGFAWTTRATTATGSTVGSSDFFCGGLAGSETAP